MPSFARREIVASGEVGLYHCVSRCVRRAFLCGRDEVSGRNFDHRKAWIRDRLKELSDVFGIDVCGYAVMSNHLHVVLRTRPDLAEQFSDAEVAQRWWRLFPKRRNDDDTPAKPTASELKALMADEKMVKERRERLSSLSWFMRCLSEPIARRSNKEDRCTGRFWEGRFKSQALLDESAVVACLAYVDLNPIRAGIAKTPETSEFTSAHDRIVARQACQEAERRAGVDQTGGQAPQAAVEFVAAGWENLGSQSPFLIRTSSRGPKDASDLKERASRDHWLAPIEVPDTDTAPLAPAGTSPATSTTQNLPSARTRTRSLKDAKRQGVLRMTQDDYLRLLDWTGRQIRRDKRGAIPSDLAGILARLQVSEETWIDTVKHFGHWFRRAAGRVERLKEAADRAGRNWFHGVTRSRQLFC